jgi:hypothetical protein
MALLSCATAAASESLWVGFHSSKGFDVMYPVSWFPIGKSRDELDILSSPKRVEGAVIPRGESEIIVREIPFVPSNDLPSFLKRAYHVTVRSKQSITLRHVPNQECYKVNLIEAQFEVAPGAVQDDTFLSCNIGGRTFLVSLTSWSGEKVNPRWRQVVLRITGSIQIRRITVGYGEGALVTAPANLWRP